MRLLLLLLLLPLIAIAEEDPLPGTELRDAKGKDFGEGFDSLLERHRARKARREQVNKEKFRRAQEFKTGQQKARAKARSAEQQNFERHMGNSRRAKNDPQYQPTREQYNQQNQARAKARKTAAVASGALDERKAAAQEDRELSAANAAVNTLSELASTTLPKQFQSRK